MKLGCFSALLFCTALLLSGCGAREPQEPVETTPSQTAAFTRESKIEDVKNAPIFGSYGRLLFPVEDAYYSGDTLEELQLTYYSHIDPDETVEIVNTLRERAADGQTILKLMTDTNLLNKKSKMEELEALLDKYVPATEALRTKLRKYDKAYKALSDENSALEAELQTAKDASKEKIADRLKYGKTEQELCELHALIDNIPPEIVAAYRRKTTGLQNER